MLYNTESKQLVAFTGTQGSGKDEAGKILVRVFGYQRLALADPVRDMALAIDPLIPTNGSYYRLSELVDMFGWDRTKRDISEVRRLLQAIGTDAVRNILGEDSWVKLAANRISSMLDSGTKVVVTDVRFPNEATMIHDLGGILIRLHRSNPEATNTQHVSESHVDTIRCDHDIANDEDLNTLVQKLYRIDGIQKIRHIQEQLSV